VREQAHDAGLARARAMDLEIAVSEAAANTVQHAAALGTLRVWHTEHEIVCEIRDSGVIADPEGAGRQPPAADASGGHGLWLVHQVCDKVELQSNAGGTTIRLHMSLSPPGREARDSPDQNGASATPDVAL
jgi:anti-sigma regulatory factor (Ser/Thr protein kinase)